MLWPFEHFFALSSAASGKLYEKIIVHIISDFQMEHDQSLTKFPL